MVKDIHNLSGVLDRDSEKYILRLFPDDQGDVRRFTKLTQGITPSRMVKYLYTLVSIKKKLDIPFKSAKEDDIKRFVAGLEKSDYAEWTKHDLKVILKKYLGKDNAIGWMKIKSVKNGKLPEEVLNERISKL